MDPIDLLVRALAFVVVLYVGWTAVRIVRWAWRKITGVRVTDVAHMAGTVSFTAEQKARHIADAFKAGRQQNRQ